MQKNSFSIKQLTADEFWPLFNLHVKSVFDNDHSYNVAAVLTPDEIEKAKTLDKNLGAPFKLFLGAFDENEKFIGWSWGIQDRHAIFYMVNSGVLKDFRRRGI